MSATGALEHALERGAACPEHQLTLMQCASLRMSNGDRAAIHNEICRLQVNPLSLLYFFT